MSTANTPAPGAGTASKRATRWVWVGVVVVLLAGLVLGTKVVPSDSALAQGAAAFDPASFGATTFPVVQEKVADRAVDAATLASAIAADPAAAAAKYAVTSSGGPVYSVTFTGVVGTGNAGIYDVAVDGVPSTLRIRVQTGPAINGTDLRDATGEITFGQFKNQIDYQNAAAALNDQVKSTVLSSVDTQALSGKTITVTGAFTLINPAAWLVTPVSLEVK